MSHAASLFEFKDLTISFQGRPALHHFSAHIRQGEMWSVLGPNGSGKSTLLRLLSGELTAWEGHFHKANLPGTAIAYLGQTPLINQDLPVRVRDVVSQGLVAKLPWGFWSFKTNSETEKQIQAAMAAMELTDLQNEIWTHLSGGQRQRALISRMLAQGAQVLLLDEPTNSLDDSSQHLLLSGLRKLNAEGHTIICVMHDEALARQYFPQSLFLGPTDCPVVEKPREMQS